MGWLQCGAGVGTATRDTAVAVREERVRDWLREREAQRRREERAEGDRRRAARRANRGQLLAEARAARAEAREAEAREAEARERDKAERDRAERQRVGLLARREERAMQARELNQHVRYMYWAGWTTKQIAEHFGVSASRIQQRLAEATSPWERDLRRRYWAGRSAPQEISTTNPEEWAAAAYEQYTDVDTDT